MREQVKTSAEEAGISGSTRVKEEEKQVEVPVKKEVPEKAVAEKEEP